MKKYQENDQQKATATRPQIPSDATGGGDPYYKSGVLPKGGFQSQWCFGGSSDRNKSATVGDGKKVY
jgi:hypothetical protein